jgi:hypothetical protein
MGKNPAFQFYVKDWLTDPALCMASHTVKGIWIDFLCYMWLAPVRGKLTGTVSQLQKLVGASKDDFDDFLNKAQSLNFAHVTLCNKNVPDCNTNVTVINRRMYQDYKNNENTRLRVQRHRKKQDGNAGCNTKVTLSSPTPTPCTPSPRESFTSVKDRETPYSPPLSKPKDKQKSYQDRFERFWKAYPKKRGKGNAERAFLKIKPDEILLQEMLDKISQASLTHDWIKESGKFIPYPATWLNAKGWLDEYVNNPLEGVLSEAGQATVRNLKIWNEKKDREEKENAEQTKIL